MPLPSFDNLFHAADATRPERGVAVAGAADPTVLQALSEARRRGWVRPVLTGDLQKIQAVADAVNVDLSGWDVHAAPDDSAVVAVDCVRQGAAAILMKGQIATPTLMKAMLDREQGLRTGETICQIVLMELRVQGRCFLLADTGVTIAPTLEQKQSLLRQTAEVARRLGCAEPGIALMSATEKVTSALPDTLDCGPLEAYAATGACGDCRVQGPLSFDLAFAADAGDKKRIEGPVAGRADVLLFPDLLSANLTVKAIMYTADCRFGGVLSGARCPVVFMSRADTVETRLHSLAYALTQPG